MFDGLKDKLSGFTSDVEEDVDEEAAEAETAESGSAAGTAESGAAEAASTVEDADEPDPAPDETDESAPTADGDPADTDIAASEATADTDTAGADDREAADDADIPDLAPNEDVEPDDDGRSLTERAKIMATGKTVIEEDDLQGHLDDLELALLSSDVEMSVANEILSGVEANLTGETRRRLSSTGNLVRDALREALYEVISVGQFDFDERVQQADKPVVIVFTGVNGVGKTTTIAKLARYFEDRGLSTVLANGDTYRAGANEQLEQHARNLDKKIITHEQGSDPTAVVYDAVEYAKANDVDVVLGDTAGRLHTSDDLMAQLAKIDRNIDPDMTLFVD